MMSSYHRRILNNPEDVDSLVTIKLGSGSTLPGYYMYHGGTNPVGRNTTLMEAQDTLLTNYNDMPVMNYDFQAPIGEFGQLRPQYHLLRRIHLFLSDFGEGFAQMAAYLPDIRPGARDDTATLRWAAPVRTARQAMFLSANYERSREMPLKHAVQFHDQRAFRAVHLSMYAPVDVPADCVFFWPLPTSISATACGFPTRRPSRSAKSTTQVAGRSFLRKRVALRLSLQLQARRQVGTPSAGRGVSFQVSGSDGWPVKVVLLSDTDSLALWKGTWGGRERIFLTQAGLVVDGATLRLTSPLREDLSVGVYPEPAGIAGGRSDGVFTRYTPAPPPPFAADAALVQIQKAGPAREIPLGKISEPVATEPGDADFEGAAIWHIKLPARLDVARNPSPSRPLCRGCCEVHAQRPAARRRFLQRQRL